MRLRRLGLRNYGCFDKADLEFATEPGHITMLVAPNGAGKSVLRRAFHDLLFDIPMQSPMKFRHGYAGMALHAEAIDAAGQAFEFGWARGGKPQPRVTSDPARFAALQQGVTPQQIERLFALDTAGLRKGGTDLKGGATLAGALLAGTGELAPAKSVRAVIDARRHANWGQGKSKPPLNAAASRLEASRKTARDAVHRPEKREREERDLEEARAQLTAAKQDRDAALDTERRLNRIALTRPHLRQLQHAEAWLAAHPGAPALPPGLDQRLAEARGQAVAAQATLDQAQQTLDRMGEVAQRIVRDPAATALAARIGQLGGRLGEAEKAAKDSAERTTQHAAKLDDVRSVLRAIGIDVPPGQAGAVLPTVGLAAEARAAIGAGAGVRKQMALAQERLAKARNTEAAAQAEPVAAQALPERLPALLREIRADRNPAQHAAEIAEAARKAEAAVRRAVALAPGWAGTAEALRAMPLPAEAAFDRLHHASEAARAEAREAGARAAALAVELGAARAALEALRGQDLPDAASIAAARAARDQGMRLVLRRAFGEPPSPGEDLAYAGAEPVALVYERQVRAADALADRRTAELERVQEAERLGRELAGLRARLPLAERERDDAAAALERSAQAWAAALAPLGLGGAATMTELRAFAAARQQLVEAMGQAEVAAAAEAALAALHQGWAARLAALLGAPPGPLAGLLARADDLAAAAAKAESAGVKRQAKLDAAQRDRRDAEEAQDQANRAAQSWQEAWARLLEALGRPPGETPDALEAVLNGMTTLDQHHREAASLKARIDDMQADLAGFAGLVAELAAELAAELWQAAPDTPMATARALIARGNQAAAAESAWRQAQLGLEQARLSAETAADSRRAAATALEAVIAACGAATPEEAEARIAASRDHADQDAARKAARQALLEHGKGLPDATLQADADAIPADEMDARHEQADHEAKAAASRAEAAAVRLSQLETAMGDEAGATDAVDARAGHEAAVAEFSRRLEDQLVLHLASTMLGDAMRSVEETMGGSSLALVSAAFAAVTDGAYTLETREGPEGEELHAVEHAYPQERKALDDLSEGTRDQLYLALRMVALREHCASATPLPFIADDILQTFDDDRAAAALRALLGLSIDLQVIVLTHLAHLKSVAAGLDGAGGARVRVVEL